MLHDDLLAHLRRFPSAPFLSSAPASAAADLDENMRVTARATRLLPPLSYRTRAQAAAEEAKNFTTLAANHAADDVLMFIAMLSDEAIDPEDVRLAEVRAGIVARATEPVF